MHFHPPMGGFHYDADEQWAVGAAPNSFGLETVALHEIGHLLGLGHSEVEGAIMYPSISTGVTKGLHRDDVDVDIDPSILPVSFSKAVFWARSRFSIVEPEITAEMALNVRTWLASSTFGWKGKEITWPSLKRCLLEGKTFLDYSLCQMTCIRILEILPAVFGKLFPLFFMEHVDSRTMVKNVFDFKWLHDLMDWGKSQLKVILVYWLLFCFGVPLG
ncbi:hypothetical protein EZV62_011620 [Acer yangbiense]|uniref:Peptidase M10 metallopeptidase domain-containing protein n=1 Tax=Acer yangbiense TaxID=1000413 RepID=A0A5C7I860_9ROSI|nr:hypothetical protein EZV62_011620 [Acer yangbiense]